MKNKDTANTTKIIYLVDFFFHFVIVDRLIMTRRGIRIFPNFKNFLKTILSQMLPSQRVRESDIIRKSCTIYSYTLVHIVRHESKGSKSPIVIAQLSQSGPFEGN